MKLIRQFIRGAGYLEGYGHHPGWGTIGIYIIVAGLSGAQRGGLDGFIFGSLFMAVTIAPFFIAGCISRANDCDRDQEKLLKTIKHSGE